MPYDRAQPYNDLPLLPPAVELETKAVLKLAISANRALANLRGLAARIPNQGMRISSITLQEARLSSEIEYKNGREKYYINDALLAELVR